jgi:hypothetical protein
MRLEGIKGGNLSPRSTRKRALEALCRLLDVVLLENIPCPMSERYRYNIVMLEEILTHLNTESKLEVMDDDTIIKSRQNEYQRLVEGPSSRRMGQFMKATIVFLFSVFRPDVTATMSFSRYVTYR